MKVFLTICERTKDLEGDFTIDKGGPTKFGICWKWDKEYLIPLGYDTPSKVQFLTWADAKFIYHDKYWVKWRVEWLKELPLVAATTFDMCFHEGFVGWECVQEVCNEWLSTELVIDGMPGPKTKKAVEALIVWTKQYPKKALNDYNLAMEVEYWRKQRYLAMYKNPMDDGYKNMVEYNSALRRLGKLA